MTADTNAGGSDAPKQEAIIRTTEEDTSKPQDLPSDGKNEDASKSTTETPKEETESKPDVAAGSVTESHSLYAKYDKEGNRSWSVKLPDHVEDAAENAETSKYALIVRRLAPKEADSSKPLIVDSIIVQSPHLKKALQPIFDDYPGIVINVSRLILQAPFECFVHRWDRFIKATEDATHDDITREHLHLLRDILQDELKDILQSRQDFIRTKAVSWAHIWTNFPPGTIIWGSKYGRPTAYKFMRGHYGENDCGKFYALRCQHIDWDGKVLGWTDAVQKVPEYLGTVPVTDLDCFPLDMHPEVDVATKMLMARGLFFQSLAGYNFRYSKGMACWWDWENQKVRREIVDSRVVIDAMNWADNVPDLSFSTTKNSSALECCNKNKNSDDDDDDDENDDAETDSDDGYSDFGHELEEEEGKEKKVHELTSDKLILTSPLVRGYSLKNRRWMEFFIDDISDIQFAENSFDSLVLNQDKKDLILAFAQSQAQNKVQFDDLVSGKGQGIVMLLAGGPGIGKTLTAETVAEEMRVPLYSMSANDLGQHAFQMESNMKRILRMVSAWNAVLLLDECDVYLEERDSHDVHRNSIVSVFLRMLEYYEGILFMTTNRVKTIDPAFKSRIHLTLHYPNLNAAARESVWRTFLSRSVGKVNQVAQGGQMHTLTDADINSLSQLDINGREIKNILKMSNLIAWQKKEVLGMAHLEKVLKIQEIL